MDQDRSFPVRPSAGRESARGGPLSIGGHSARDGQNSDPERDHPALRVKEDVLPTGASPGHAARRFSRSPEVEASSVGDRVVLYHRTTRSALVLNPMATWLWQLLGIPRTAAALVAEIRDAFPDVTEQRARTDLAALLDDLVRHGVVAQEA
jgi:hypothetical protein